MINRSWSSYSVDGVAAWARRMFASCLVALWFGLHGAGTAWAEPIIMDGPGEATIDLAPHTLYFIDPDARLGIDEVVDQLSAFEPVETRYIDFGLGSFRVWTKFTLYNPAENDQVWRLDTGRPYPDELAIYTVINAAPAVALLNSTSAMPFAARSLPMRVIAADVEVPAGGLADVYVSFRSSNTTYLPLRIGRPEAIVAARGGETVVDALLDGALMAMLVTALFMLPVIGRRLALAFTGYILAGIFYVSHADGYLFQYLWPNAPELNASLNLTFILLMTAGSFNFARILFDFEKTWPAYDKFLMGCCLLALVCAALALFLIEISLFQTAAYLIVPAGAVIHPVTGVLAYRRKYLGALPYLLGGLIVLLTFLYALLAHLIPGRFSLDNTLDLGHGALLTEAFAFAAAIVIRLLGLQKERDRAIEAELASTREKLSMSSALRDARKQYLDAQALASRRREQLSSVSHDLQQPLSMLRHKLGTIVGDDEAVIDQMHNALDYLEKLARDQIRNDDAACSSQSDGRIESFSIGVILANARQMFEDEARSKGLCLQVRPSDEPVEANAVALMRVVSNMVHNAIRHTATGGVLVGVRRRAEHLVIEVWDTGPGMSEDDVSRLLKRREKGAGSPGDGLGLSIITDIAETNDFRFGIRSWPGRGTCARLSVPHRP